MFVYFFHLFSAIMFHNICLKFGDEFLDVFQLLDFPLNGNQFFIKDGNFIGNFKLLIVPRIYQLCNFTQCKSHRFGVANEFQTLDGFVVVMEIVI